MIVFGASGHAKVILDLLFQTKKKVEYIADDRPPVEELFGIPIRTTVENYSAETEAIIAIGNNAARQRFAGRHALSYQNAVHPTAVVSVFSKIGNGTVVMAGTVINAGAIIGQHCILNTACVVEHDCILEDFVHISPNATLAGNVQVGKGAHIGLGASIIQGIRIGKWATIGAGAVIIRDVPDHATVVGNPGRIIK